MTALWGHSFCLACAAIPAFCLFFPAFAATHDMTPGRSVSRQLRVLPHRVPGTVEYRKAADIIEKTLRDAGIKVVRQTFQTPVPEMTRLRLEIAGRTIPIHALMPNNAGLISTGEAPLKAEMVYYPGKKADWNRPVAGRIALLDWGSGSLLQTVFSEGAQAVIFVGNSKTDQWEAARLLSSFQSSFPCFYMEREVAETNGFLSGKPFPALLQAHSRWKNAEGINLWVCLPAGEERTFALERPEAILLGARLDTFGMVPGLCRGDRERENIALLVQMAADLKRIKLPRTVFCLFYGGSFNAYDGIRNFLFPFVSARTRQFPEITDFSAGLREELKKTEKMLDFLPHSFADSGKAPQVVFGIFHYSLAAVLLLIWFISAFGFWRRKQFPFSFLAAYWKHHRRISICVCGLLLFFLLSLPFLLEKLFPGDLKTRQADNELAHAARSLLTREIVRAYNQNNYELALVNRSLRRASTPREKKRLQDEKKILDGRRLEISNLRQGVSDNKISPPCGKRWRNFRQS